MASKTTITINVPTQGVDPFGHNTTRSKRSIFKELMNLLRLVVVGGILHRATSRPTVVAGTARATGTVVCSAVDSGDTLSINGQALTATKHNATGTVTITVANTDADDTVTVNGVVFTAKASESLTAREFTIGGTDAAAATSLAACINAASANPLSDLYNDVTAQAASNVVTIRAVSAGTGGDAITLASNDADGLAVSGATLSGGAAVANDQFDYVGSNAQTARALANAINASTSDLIEHHVKAGCRAATITLASVAAGQWVSVDGVKFTAVSESTPTQLDQFSIGGTDTQDATALKNAINAHPSLKDRVVASSSSGVVTVREMPPELTNAVRLEKSGAGITLSGSACADTATVLVAALVKGHAGNAITIAGSDADIAASGARLTGGTSTTYTF